MSRTRGICAAIALIALLPVAGIPTAGATGPFTTLDSGLDGGGFMSIVAPNPYAQNTILAGADVMGIWRSIDGGDSWNPVNSTLTGTVAGVAALTYSKPYVHTQLNNLDTYDVYAAMGPETLPSGGFYTSTDGGSTWAPTTTSGSSAKPQFTGGNTKDNVPGAPSTGHPRSTGNLIAVDQPVAGTAPANIYVATLALGIMRSTDVGKTWCVLPGTAPNILNPYYWRSLVIDPANPSRLYASAFKAAPSVYRIDVTLTAPCTAPIATITELSGSPEKVEEIAISGGTLYMAGATGFARRNLATGATFVMRSGKWYTVTAYADVVYAGSYAPASLGGGAWRAISSYAGGTTTDLTAIRSQISTDIEGTPGRHWWMNDAMQTNWIFGAGFEVSSIARDPFAPGRLFVAAQGGLYRYDAATGWVPIVDGLAITFNRAVAVDPRDSQRVYIANTDWAFLHSTDAGISVHPSRPSSGAERAASVGYAIAVDGVTDPSTVYVGLGNRDANTGGGVWSSPAGTFGTWTNEGSPDAAGPAGKRVIGLAVGRSAGCTVVLAAVEQAGIFRKLKDCDSPSAWTLASPIDQDTERRAVISWAGGTRPNLVFAGDQSGILRSTNAGLTWTRLLGFAKPAQYLSQDPATPARLWVISGNTLNVIYGADGDVCPAPPLPGPCDTTIATLSGVGPIVALPGAVDVAEPSKPNQGQRVRERTNGWTTLSDAAFGDYLGRQHWITVGGDGSRYVAMNGNGVLILRPPPP